MKMKAFYLYVCGALALCVVSEEPHETVTWNKTPFAKAIPKELVSPDKLHVEADSHFLGEMKFTEKGLRPETPHQLIKEYLISDQPESVVQVILEPDGHKWVVVDVLGLETPEEIFERYLQAVQNEDQAERDRVTLERARHDQVDEHGQSKADFRFEKERLGFLLNEVWRKEVVSETEIRFHNRGDFPEARGPFPVYVILQRGRVGWMIKKGL